MNKKIKKMTIKTTSGYCSYDYAYEDKMVITENSLTYSCKPLSEKSVHAPSRWSYRSYSKVFSDWFDEVCRLLREHVFNRELDCIVMDAGEISFNVVFEDGARSSFEFPFTDSFDELLTLISKMVPDMEDMPVMLQNI